MSDIESAEHEASESKQAEADEEKPMTAAEEERKVRKWLTEIRLQKNSPLYKTFVKEGKQVVKVYKNEAITSSDINPRVGSSIYNVTWSSIQTMKPSFYSRIPKPAVIRLHKTENPVKKLAVTVAERCTSFSLKQEEDAFNQIMEAVVEDRLLPGRGIAKVIFESELREKLDPMTGQPIIGEDGQPVQETYNERASTRYIYWPELFHNQARIWSTDVEWLAIRHTLSKAEIKKRFDTDKLQASKLITYNASDAAAEKILQSEQEKQECKKAEVFEVWCKESKSVYWVSEGLKDKFLKIEEDPLKLDSFFPVARPLMATCTSDSMIPVCDYRITKKIVEDLDTTFTRVSALVDCVRFVGLHDASVSTDMIKMRALPDGQTTPVRSWAQFAEKGGIKGCVDWFPIERVVEVIRSLAEHGQMLLGQYFEITGIPDIIRGSSAPSESATAQQFKGQFATIRIADKQADVQRFCRDIVSMKAEIIFELFSDETIMMMSGYDDMSEEEQQLFPQALAILRNDRAKQFVIDIETDSTLALDENAEKSARLEFLSSLGQFFQNAMGMMQLHPDVADLAFESIKFGADAFRQGRELTGAIDSTLAKVKDSIQAQKDAEAAQQEQIANQPPPKDPAEIKAEADMMIAQFKAELAQQSMAQKAEIEQVKVGIEQQKAASKAETDRALVEQKMAIEKMKAQQEVLLKRYKTDADIQIEAEKIRTDRAIAISEASTSEIDRAIRDIR